MKAYWGVEVQLARVHDLGAGWKWFVSFTLGRFTPRERAPCTYWI